MHCTASSSFASKRFIFRKLYFYPPWSIETFWSDLQQCFSKEKSGEISSSILIRILELFWLFSWVVHNVIGLVWIILRPLTCFPWHPEIKSADATTKKMAVFRGCSQGIFKNDFGVRNRLISAQKVSIEALRTGMRYFIRAFIKIIRVF